MDNITIEQMDLSHLESMKDILESDFDDFWNYNVFKNELNNKNSRYIIAKNNNEIVGFAGVSIILDTADITNIVVKKSFRGNGVSNILLKFLIELCKSCNCNVINLEVNCNNLVAINLYKKFGFIQNGLRKNYYDGNDGLLFTKTFQ